MNITISKATFLLTGLSSLYKASTTNIWSTWTIRALTMPRRNSDSEAIMLWAVAAVLPGTKIMEGTYIIPKIPNGAIARYSHPVTLAKISGDVPAVWLVI